MLKRILPALIWISGSAVAHAAVNPIPLLVEQCLQLPQPTITLSANNDVALDAVQFERQLIGLNNINDRLKYYRDFPINRESREALLNCQLSLADKLDVLVNQADYYPLVLRLSASDNQQHQALGQQLQALAYQHLGQAEKAQLHTAQAGIRQNLLDQQLSLTISAKQCQLSPVAGKDNVRTPPDEASDTATSTAPASDESFNHSIAGYLLAQPKSECRKMVWQEYQGRATARNHSALNRIFQLRQQQALRHGFSDYASLALSQQTLNTPELVDIFLTSQIESLHLAPWNIGQALASLDSEHFAPISSDDLMATYQGTLTELGLKFETLSADITRVWYQGRLLGELYLVPSDRNRVNVLRYSVIGQQFGQVALSYKSMQSSAKDVNNFSQQVSEAIVTLATGSHYYLSSALGFSQDSHDIPALWLTQVLNHSLISAHHIDINRAQSRQLTPNTQGGSNAYHVITRTELAARYRKQLQVFRAMTALHYYQSPSDATPHNQLSDIFKQSFGEYWQSVEDYPYSFSGIAVQGPLVYQGLWQETLANYLYRSNPLCLTEPQIFEHLVVNPNGDSFTSLLTTLIAPPVDPLSLINRMKYEQESQPQSTRTCLL